jgi:hypothetical protein
VSDDARVSDHHGIIHKFLNFFNLSILHHN